ncbi:hypothetical protein [Flavitalea sp.]|nr:hypothetical protein [Flavitalea sp.]
MRIVVFFASLFFMLLGGRIDAFAGINLNNSYSASAVAYHTDKKEPVIFNADAGQASIQKTTVPEENKIYFCEDAEEEDDNQSSRKYQPVSDFFSGFSYQSQLAFLDNCYDATPFLYLQASPRYIFQRTLRI